MLGLIFIKIPPAHTVSESAFQLEKQGEGDDLYGTCYFLCILFGVVAFIGFVGFLITGLSSIINPGYKVINEIIEWIK